MSSSFSFASVWELVCRIPCGQVATYGQIARLLGHPRAARLVGYALSGAPKHVPCHRVVSRTGGLSEAFSPLGRESHRLLLLREGVPFTEQGLVDIAQCHWSPSVQEPAQL